MLNWIFAWWLIGIAWFVVEFTQGGGAKHLAKLTRKEAEHMPPALLPLAAFLVALMLIGLVFYYLVEFSERFLIPWHISVRSDALPSV